MKPLKQGPTARTEPRPSHPQATHFTTVHRAQRGTLSASRAPVPGSQEVSAGKKRLHVKRASRARWGAAPSPPTTVRDDHTGEALEWWTGWRASPCPTPDLRTLPAVLVPPGTVARRPGDCWVSGACRFSNTAAKVPTPRRLQTPRPKASALDKGGSQLLPVFQTASRKPPSTSPPKAHSAS